MQYLIYPFILLIYFEILGRAIFAKLNKKEFEFSFLIGFIVVMATLYVVTWPISAFDMSFYTMLTIDIILFILSIIFIITQFKKISFKFNWKLWVLFIVLVLFGMLISYNRTLGETHGFDTLYYLNFVDFNIGNQELNSLHPHFGTYPNWDEKKITYVFQSFYYFVSVIIYIFRSGLSIIGKSFETLPAYTWGFQILLTMVLNATAITCLKEIKIKNKILELALAIMLIGFIGNFYYNNALGFIGNNYRMSIHAIATLFLFRYFKENDDKDLYIFYISQLALCALASTGTFSAVFVLFGLFFVLYNKRPNLLKEYVFVLFVPTINILATKLGLTLALVVIVAILFLMIYLLNNFILKIYQNKYLRFATIIIPSLFLIIMSFTMTRNIFSFDVFLNNYSEIADMSWDYFMFNDLRHWIFNLFILIPLFYYLFKYHKEPFAIISIVLIVVVFNPFGCTFMNFINWVYYRSYDIIINQFTMIYFIYVLYNDINKEKFKNIFTVTIIISSIILTCIQIPRFYHKSFIPDEDYNPILKMENTEYELITNVRKLIEDQQIKNPKIINSTFYMPSFIDNSTYLFGKEKRYNYPNYNEDDYNLYLIFFPIDYSYDNFRPDTKPDYENTIKYLNNTDYNILIVDNLLYYTAENGDYLPLTSLVEADGTYVKSEYSTAKYAVYYLK